MSNPYYSHSTYPTPNAPGSSAALRAELDLIAGGFDLLPTLSGNGYKVAMVNAAGTALIASSALQSLAITSSTIDGTPIGATTRAAGNFTTISVSGAVNLGSNVTIAGGTINNTPIGGTTPSSGAFTTLSSSGGITGTLTGNVTGNLTGNVTGNVSGNAGTVTNGVYTSGSYADPGWLTSLSASKLTGLVALASGGTGASTAAGARTALGLAIGTDIPSLTGTGASGTWGINVSGNAATVTNGVYTTGTYANPSWLTSLAGSKVSGDISGNAANVTGTVALANGGTGATSAATALTNLGALPTAGGTMTGSLAFNGTGLRITGDFTNATFASRTMVQTSTANGQTFFGVIPNGTGVNAQLQAFNSSDPNNSSIAALVASASQVRLVSGYVGTGTINPITIIFSSTEAARFATSGNFLVNTTTDDGVNKVQVAGTIKSTSGGFVFPDGTTQTTASSGGGGGGGGSNAYSWFLS